MLIEGWVCWRLRFLPILESIVGDRLWLGDWLGANTERNIIWYKYWQVYNIFYIPNCKTLMILENFNNIQRLHYLAGEMQSPTGRTLAGITSPLPAICSCVSPLILQLVKSFCIRVFAVAGHILSCVQCNCVCCSNAIFIMRVCVYA